MKKSIDLDLQKFVRRLFFTVGAGLLAGSAVSAVLTSRFIQSASRAEGEVVRLSAGGAHPVVRFRPAAEPAAKPLEFSTSGLINSSVGDRVTVLYRLDDQWPSGFHANIDSLGTLWFPTALLSGLGGGFALASFWLSRSQPARS